MSFLKELIEDFTGKDKAQNDGPPGHYPQSQQYGASQAYNGPPPVSPPWVAEWDSRDNRWLYVNRETGERTFEHPQNQGYRGQGQGGFYEQEPAKQSHTGRNVALGAAAGLAGGALAMHEGEKIGECLQDYDLFPGIGSCHTLTWQLIIFQRTNGMKINTGSTTTSQTASKTWKTFPKMLPSGLEGRLGKWRISLKTSRTNGMMGFKMSKMFQRTLQGGPEDELVMLRGLETTSTASVTILETRTTKAAMMLETGTTTSKGEHQVCCKLAGMLARYLTGPP